MAKQKYRKLLDFDYFSAVKKNPAFPNLFWDELFLHWAFFAVYTLKCAKKRYKVILFSSNKKYKKGWSTKKRNFEVKKNLERGQKRFFAVKTTPRTSFTVEKNENSQKNGKQTRLFLFQNKKVALLVLFSIKKMLRTKKRKMFFSS